jgi:hypothetical protein
MIVSGDATWDIIQDSLIEPPSCTMGMVLMNSNLCCIHDCCWRDGKWDICGSSIFNSSVSFIPVSCGEKKCMEIRCKGSLGIASSNAAVMFDGFWHTLQRKVEEENNMRGHGRRTSLNVQRTSLKAVSAPLLISSICQSNLIFTLYTADTSCNWRDEEDAGR